jgi:hypothetical protein
LHHAFVPGRLAGRQRFEEFQSHIALQFFIVRAIHHAHATFAELLFDDVVADPLPNHNQSLLW